MKAVTSKEKAEEVEDGCDNWQNSEDLEDLIDVETLAAARTRPWAGLARSLLLLLLELRINLLGLIHKRNIVSNLEVWLLRLLLLLLGIDNRLDRLQGLHGLEWYLLLNNGLNIADIVIEVRIERLSVQLRLLRLHV